MSASIANVAGYAVGLTASFALGRRFVFRGSDAAHREAVRFLVAFAVAFGANFLVLQVLLRTPDVNEFAAQVAAGCVYTACMYALGRWFVFRQGRGDSERAR